MRKQLLFVTYQNEDFDEGLVYALDLAKAMNEDLTILMTHKKHLTEKFNDLMTAVTFAEAGEHETVREILAEDMNEKSENKLNRILEKCQNSLVTTRVYTVALDTFPAIQDFLKSQNSVDMVLLSPSITDNGNFKSGELQRLVRTASRPIVTMSRQVYAV